MSQIDLQWFGPEEEGKTEEATETKLRKAREEGRIAKSQELCGTVVFLFVSVTLIFMAKFIFKRIMQLMYYYFTHSTADKVDDASFYNLCVRELLIIVVPLCSIGIIAGVISNLVQNRGFIFTTKTIKPNFSKLIPKFGEYFKKNFFSMMGVFNTVKSIVKVIVISIIAFTLISVDVRTTLGFLHNGEPYLAMVQVAGMVAKLLIVSSIVLVVIGVLDYVMQRRDFKRQMKMTKQEVKEEFKESEGDPEVKGRLENAQKTLLTQNMAKAVRESDVVITNPTHYAVSLQWKRDSYDAPQITAKGTDNTALQIKKIARENDVPVVENRSLARGLYNDTEVGNIIPVAYFRAIATVYSQVGFMDKKRK